MSDTAEPLPLQAGIRSRSISGVNCLNMHILEAGFESDGTATKRPLVLLLQINVGTDAQQEATRPLTAIGSPIDC
jgi:hypothetical protein